MALQVWLPLNGDLKNRGILGDTGITGGPSSWSDGGKIGKCQYGGDIKISASVFNSIVGTGKNFSVCFWYKSGSGVAICGTNGNGEGSGPRTLDFFAYPTENDLHWSNGGWGGYVISGVLSSTSWTHICLTVDSDLKYTVYINGVASYTDLAVVQSYDYDYHIGMGGDHYINDFHLYDNCLSPAEVREIAKGLVIHYPLDEVNKNLVSGNYSCKSTKNSFTESGSINCTLTADDIINNQGRTLFFSADICNEGEINHNVSSDDWRYERFGAHGNITINGNTNYPLTDLLQLNKRPGRYSCSWTIPTGITSCTNLTFGSQCNPEQGYCNPGQNNDSTWYWKNIKLEWDSITPYTNWFDKYGDSKYDTSKASIMGVSGGSISVSGEEITLTATREDVYTGGITYSRGESYNTSYGPKLYVSDTSKSLFIYIIDPVNKDKYTAYITCWDENEKSLGAHGYTDYNDSLIYSNGKVFKFDTLEEGTSFITIRVGVPSSVAGDVYKFKMKAPFSFPKVYDCSGYENNGIPYDSPIPYSDSPRYERSLSFDGGSSAIQIPSLPQFTSDGTFTMNVWFYKDSWGSKGYETILGGPSGFEIEAKNSSTNSPVIMAYSWGSGTIPYELGKWNMLTMTRTTSGTKFYLNGVEKLTGSAGSIPSGNYFIGAWNTSSQQNYKGMLSDFRLYTTALSPEDIQELYHTSVKLTKSGTLMCYEIKED